MNTIKQFLLFAALTLILLACSHKNQKPTEQESNLVEITNQQFITDSMHLGKIEPKTFERTIKCNGTIVPLPNGMAKVSAPVNGTIKSIHCFNGQPVTKFQPLIEISGSEMIDLQRDFAEVAANHTRVKNEYERIRSLYNEKVTSEKDFIFAETEFKTSLARYQGLKLKIEAIGLSVSKIENGEFYASYVIKSPINGYISRLKTNIGSYIDTQTELLEIINPDLLQIKLSVFAKDANDLQTGQSVRFKSVNTEVNTFATISIIGVAVDDDTKSIACYASISNKKLSNHRTNEYIEAEIITNTEPVMALPSGAVIKNENGYFVLVLDKQESERYFFRKAEVKIGKQQEGFTEIMEPRIDGPILTKGVYNLSL